MKQFGVIAVLFSGRGKKMNIIIITTIALIIPAVNGLSIHNGKPALRWAPFNETLKASDNVGGYFCRVRQVKRKR